MSNMISLSKKNLPDIQKSGNEIPGDHIFKLPEKILQFGTGVLLRALPDYFVDKANRQGVFNGRILVVKSTGNGDTNAFRHQDGMYTLCVRGIEDGVSQDYHSICSSISRVLAANHDWPKILESASNPDLQIVVSNTTEIGIRLVKESIFQEPPSSFPAKLLAFLYQRFIDFQGAASAGMIIIPTELLTDNGKKLKSILLELVEFNHLEPAFRQWLELNNRFCNSLVDRIVPGKPETIIRTAMETDWGYTDELVSVCEPYRLWAIEGGEEVKQILSFSSVDQGIVITADITKYKELKLRMLNATHTLSCGLAYLSGFETVGQALENPDFDSFVHQLMMEEIGQAIPIALGEGEISEFGTKVLDRFRNPFLRHQWLNITMQYSSKMSQRVVPVLNRYYELYKKPPELIATGFAAFILFTRPVKKDLDKYYGILHNEYYLINDDRAAYFFSLWQKITVDELVHTLLANAELWQSDLGSLQGFGDLVTKKLKWMIKSGPLLILAERK
jgi:tagaturonate reductase